MATKCGLATGLCVNSGACNANDGCIYLRSQRAVAAKARQTPSRRVRKPRWCVCARGCRPCPNVGRDFCFHSVEQPYRFRTMKCRDSFDRTQRAALRKQGKERGWS